MSVVAIFLDGLSSLSRLPKASLGDKSLLSRELHNFGGSKFRLTAGAVCSFFLCISGILATSCRKSGTPTAADSSKTVEVSGSVSNEDPTEFTQADESVQIGGVNLAESSGYTVIVFAVESSGNLRKLYTKHFTSNKINFRLKAQSSRYLLVKTIKDNGGGTFSAILPPLNASDRDGKIIRMIFDRTTSVASKMLEIVSDLAKSGNQDAQKSLEEKSISVVDALMVAQAVRRTVDQQILENKPSEAIDLVTFTKPFLEGSNKRFNLLASEGLPKKEIARKIADKAYENIYGSYADSTAPGILAYRTNLGLGTSESAKKEVAYEAIQAAVVNSFKPVAAAFQTEADFYRTAASMEQARSSEAVVSAKFASVFRVCITNTSGTCFATNYTPPPPPSSLDADGSSGAIPKLPGGPQISILDQSFNTSFATDISQNSTPMENFKEFRYTLTGVDPTCSSGTASSSQPTTVNISTVTTVLKAVSCDQSGNSSVVTTVTYTYDTTPPSAPVVSSTSPFAGSSSVTWTWNSGGGGNGNYRYRVDNADLSVGTTNTSTLTATVGSLAQGSHTLYVQERDAAGNWSASGSFAVTVDTTPPGAPQISVASGAFNQAFLTNISQNASPDTNFKEFRYTTNGADPTCSTGTALDSQPGSVNISAATTTLKVVSCDMAGNMSSVSSATYTYDNTPPNAPTVTSTSSYSSSTSVTWTWSSGGGGSGNFRYKVDSSDLTSGATAISSLTVTINSLSQAAHTLYVQERDAVGNWSASGSFAVIVDTTSPGSPQVSVATSSFNASFSTNISQNSTTDTNFKEFRYTTTGVDPSCSTGTASSLQPTSVTIPAATTTLKAISCDQAGNSSGVTTTTYTYDNTPPNAPNVTSSSPTSSSSSVTWTWTSGGGGGNGNYRYRLDNSNLTTGATTTSTSSATLTSLSNGAHTLYVQERDAAGNWSNSGSYEVTVTASGLALGTVSRGGIWILVSWSAGTAPYTAKLYSDASCATEIRSLTSITGTAALFGGLTSGVDYYHRIFDSSSSSTVCTLKNAGMANAATLTGSSTSTDYSSISLSFNDPDLTGIANFVVWKFTGSGCTTTAAQYSTIAAVNDAGTEKVTGLDSEAAYSFRIFSDTVSAFSACVTASTLANNAAAIYPFDDRIVLKVKNTLGPLRVRGFSTSLDCSGASFYDSGTTISAGNYVGISSLSNSSFYSVLVTDSNNYSTCHSLTTTSILSPLMLNPTASVTAGDIDLGWTAGNGGAYIVIRFPDNTGACEGNGVAVFSHNSSTSTTDTIGSGNRRDYLVISGDGGAGYVRPSNCASAQAN